MEYADAPSGFVTLYNYKEPFMKYEKGYGMQGVLLFDGETDKVQCHICGKWFINLSAHIPKEHAMKVAAYKEEVGLSKGTALIGENMRAKLIAAGLDKRLQNLRSRKGIKHTAATIAKIKANHASRTRQYQNKHGTCPEQLIERLIAEYKKQGRTPVERNLQFHDALINTYGTYRNACKFAGIPEPVDSLIALAKGRETMRLRGEETKKAAIERVFDFYDKNKRLPKPFELEEKYKRYLDRIGLKKRNLLLKDVVVRHGRFNESVADFRFSKEELLVFIKNFDKIHDRKPSYSDARLRLIPHLSRYSYHFGSWKNALREAFRK